MPDDDDLRAELRAHLRAINALGEAQRETRAALTGRMNSLEAEMRTGFVTMQAGMTQIVGLLGGKESPER